MNILNKNNLFLLEELVRKNFSNKYKESYLGILWSVIRPLLTMIVLTIVFSTIFKGKIENYPVYLLSGRTIYRYFVGTCGNSMFILKSNKQILLQKSIPKYIFILATIISEFINFIISILLLSVVMVATNAPFYFNLIPLAIIPVISLLIMITGVSLILSIACVYYADIQHLWGVFSQLLLYASAVFYPLDIIPEPYHSVIVLNPLLWIIDQFRHFIVFGDLPNMLNIVDSYLLSFIILIIGIIIFKKYEKKVTIKI